MLKDMNGFMSAQTQKSLIRLSGAVKRLGFFDYVDVLKVMQENLIAARVRKDYSAKFFDGNSFTKYGKDFFASSLQAFEYIEVGENEPLSRNPLRAVLSFVPVDFFGKENNSVVSFPIFVDTTVRLYRFGGTSDNIVLKFVYNEEKFVMKMDTLLKKLDRAIKKVPCADNPRLVNLYLMKALEARELAKKELVKVRDVAEGEIITYYTKQFEKLSNLIDDLDSNLR